MERRYKIRNWSEYNKSLVKRGNVTIWFSEETIKAWLGDGGGGRKGRPQIYSDDAILCALLIKTMYGLPLRAVEGFLQSLVLLMGLSIPVPSYSQISRRSKKLEGKVKELLKGNPRELVLDATGLKVYGEGEWKVRQHGRSKRRTWRKLHIGLDVETGEIVMAELTKKEAGDGQTGEKLLKEHSKEKSKKTLKRVYGDGAYDGIEFRRVVHGLGAEAVVPPPRHAVHHSDATGALAERNNGVLEILGLGGDEEARALWKRLKRYYRRSLVETAIYRVKKLTGGDLRSRCEANQRVEAFVKCLTVNRITKLGMPVGEWVAVS